MRMIQRICGSLSRSFFCRSSCKQGIRRQPRGLTVSPKPICKDKNIRHMTVLHDDAKKMNTHLLEMSRQSERLRLKRRTNFRPLFVESSSLLRRFVAFVKKTDPVIIRKAANVFETFASGSCFATTPKARKNVDSTSDVSSHKE